MENPNRDKNLRKLKPIDEARELQLTKIARGAIATYHGDIDYLETALGVLRLGDHLGWRALVIIHNKRTIRRFEDILGINIREFFPEEGSIAERSIGYKIAKAASNFWKAVSGDIKIDRRRDISS